MIKLLQKAISIYHQKGYFLRWIDKRSLILFLVFKKLIPRKKNKSDESPILVICDLLLWDLAISGFFFIKLNAKKVSDMFYMRYDKKLILE